jgi:hypothetical protein
MNKKVKNGNAVFWKTENGIIHIEYLQKTNHTIEDSKEQVTFIKKLNGGQNALIVSDPSKVVSIDDSSKKYYETDEVKKTIKAIALIVNGYFTKHVINFVFKAKGPNTIPSKAFKSRKNAEEWLLSL